MKKIDVKLKPEVCSSNFDLNLPPAKFSSNTTHKKDIFKNVENSDEWNCRKKLITLESQCIIWSCFAIIIMLRLIFYLSSLVIHAICSGGNLCIDFTKRRTFCKKNGITFSKFNLWKKRTIVAIARILGFFATVVFILMVTGNGIKLSYEDNTEETLLNGPGEAKFIPMLFLDPLPKIQDQLCSFDICLKSKFSLRLSRITLGNLSIPVQFVFSYLHDDTGEVFNDESRRVQLTEVVHSDVHKSAFVYKSTSGLSPSLSSEEDIKNSSSFLQYVLSRSFDDNKYSCVSEMTRFARLELFSDLMNFSVQKLLVKLKLDELYLNDDLNDILCNDCQIYDT